MLEHGGRLRSAARRYDIPLASWLDLSTGISPWCYPIPDVPSSVWHRLPEPDDALDATAARYYGNAQLLATSGSQAAIQALPHLFPRGAVTIIGPTYNEHAAAWSGASHDVYIVKTLKEAIARAAPITLLCNPNNPTAMHTSPDQLLDAASQLGRCQGRLIVDEAYGDAFPALSVTPYAGTTRAPQLITLRSLGKFFGLAGARVGFVFGDPEMLDRLNDLLGPWTINGPARWVAERALGDLAWHAQQQARIIAAGAQLESLLRVSLAAAQIKSTGLFSTCAFSTPAAAGSLFEHLAQGGILTRLFKTEGLVRIGIPDEHDWNRLTLQLQSWQNQPLDHHDN